MIYLLGYRDGASDYSWSMDFFPQDVPVEKKMSRKQVMDLGYKPFCGIGPKVIEACDYYIAHYFGAKEPK